MRTCDMGIDCKECPGCETNLTEPGEIIEEAINRNEISEILKRETRTVSLYVWEQGYLYPHNEWECEGYSEFICGVPKYAEIRRI